MTAQRLYRVLVASIFFAVFISIGGFWFADKQLKTRSMNVSNLIAERDAQTDKIDKLRVSKNSVQDVTKLNDIINSLLPQQKKQENLIADIIYTATKEAGVPASQITTIAFSGTGAPSSLSGTSASKDIQGVFVYPFSLLIKDISYTTMLKLFTELEKNKRIIQTDQVQISPDKSRPGNISSLSLSLKTFVQP